MEDYLDVLEETPQSEVAVYPMDEDNDAPSPQITSDHEDQESAADDETSAVPDTRVTEDVERQQFDEISAILPDEPVEEEPPDPFQSANDAAIEAAARINYDPPPPMGSPAPPPHPGPAQPPVNEFGEMGLEDHTGTPMIRNQIRDVLGSGIEEMQMTLYGQMNDAIAEVESGLERRNSV